AFLLAFMPPRWLRRLGQQAVAYRFLTELAAVGPGAGVARLWQQLAEAAAGLTGALRAEVRLSDGGTAPLAAVGVADPATPPTRVVPLGNHPRRAELQLWTAGEGLFADDDLTLLELLGAQTQGAAEREEVLAERTALAERLATTNAALVQASAAKSDFLAAMSHELRTPLNAILGFSELLLAPLRGQRLGEEEVREYAGHIHGAGRHLLELINDVLDLSKVEANRLELRYERVDVARLVAETIDTVRPLAETKHQSLDRALPGALEAEADPARLRQIVYNLLSNAIKFTPPEGRVTVELGGDDHELRLVVVDSGPGIAPADQERIFAPFEQLTPGAGEGTGLGLALTRRLVETHGGRIELTSSPGAGSRFSVILPRRRPAQGEAPSVEVEPGTGPLVLVVEDDAAAAELLRLQLGRAGYRTAVAADGESGLEAARRLAPAAILLDILLPGLDGWEVLKRLRADPATAVIPVMVVTIVDDAALGLALGAVDYFVKPVARETLLAALGRLTFTTKVRERTVTVLAIDDDPATLALYRSALTPSGFRILEAASGRDGLAQASANSVDLIVLDLQLPDVDGFEVAARLKADPATAQIPILVVTGQTLTDEDKARLNHRVVGVLAKGDEALEGLRSWLARASRRPE
ncbi:MAG TPA: response regulator, partial [Candidatus Limnocylindrales bacterium]|nr:response regulator [Candidatus Limnocylindrales bacterium]